MGSRSKAATLRVACVAACMSTSTIAYAQSTPTPPARDEMVLEEIIVTAQKRDERLQEVPVSVSVFGAQGLEMAKIDSGTEIARQTPNLRVSVLGNENQPKFALRGISTSEFNLNAVSPTGVFYDEVYVGAQYLGGAQVFDIERIEVLRGPQGTLFGKNTTAGAVNYISRGPSFMQEAEMSIGAGSYGYVEAKGVAEVPLVEDRLSARFAFNVAHSKGYIENVNPAISDRSNIDRKAGRLTLGYQDENDLKATLRVFHNGSDAKAIGVINTGTAPGGLNALGVDPRINPYTGQRMTRHQMATDRDGDLEVRGSGLYLNVQKDLGPVSITSITSHLRGRFLNNVDADGTTRNLLHIDFRAKNKETSQDLRIATNGSGAFNVIAGLYYFRDDIDIDTTYTIFGGPPVLPILNQSFDQRRTSYAAYIDGTLELSDMFTAYGGLRYTDDKGRLSNFQVTPVIAKQPTLTYHDAKPTGRVGLRAQLDDDVMLFGQFARGYRSSAFNGGALTNAADLNVADPEKLDAYEVGLKSQWFDRRLTANVSTFLYNFSNQQFINLVGINNQQLVNAGKSRTKGVELELSARVTPELTVNAGLGLLDAEYRRLVLNGVNLSGNDMIEAPHHTANMGADYRIVLDNDGAILLHADATHVGKQYFQANNSALSRGEAFWDVGARIAYRAPNDRYELSVYAKNLTDNREVTGIVVDATSQTRFATVPYPRRFGVELSGKF